MLDHPGQKRVVIGALHLKKVKVERLHHVLLLLCRRSAKRMLRSVALQRNRKVARKAKRRVPVKKEVQRSFSGSVWLTDCFN